MSAFAWRSKCPELREGGRHLVCLPMFHIGGAGWAIWAMQEGSTAIIVRETCREPLLKTMVEQKVETALLAPTLMLFLTELPASRTADFSALRHITYGTAPISPELLRRSIETFKCRFSQLYGLTETTGPITALSHEHHVGERMLSCGRPMFGGEVRVVDADGNDLPPGQVGEILYHGESLMAAIGSERRKPRKPFAADGFSPAMPAISTKTDSFSSKIV